MFYWYLNPNDKVKCDFLKKTNNVHTCMYTNANLFEHKIAKILLFKKISMTILFKKIEVPNL
jgi:hypothetical protein